MNQPSVVNFYLIPGVNKGNMPDNSQTKSSMTPAEYITGHNIKSMIYHSSSDLGHY